MIFGTESFEDLDIFNRIHLFNLQYSTLDHNFPFGYTPTAFLMSINFIYTQILSEENA